MKQASTLFLRLALLVLALVPALVIGYTLPSLITGDAEMYVAVLLLVYASALPYCFALYQALRLLRYIDQNNAFSDLSIRALKHIKYSALAISAWYTLGLPLIYMAAEKDDAPGVILIGMVVAGASLVIATFAAVLQKLLQTGMEIKSENDLTV